MNAIVYCGLAPHPPILLPEIGGKDSEKVSSTYKAMERLAREIGESGAETILILSPHGLVFQDGVAINGSEILKGDLKQFRTDLKFEYASDPGLIQAIITESAKLEIASLDIDDALAMEYGASDKLDHGVLVPMYFLDKHGIDLPLVSVAMSFLPPQELYAFGMSVKNAAESIGRKVAVIASGDMSHRLTAEAPAGYSPQGAAFDLKIKALLEQADVKGIVGLDAALAEKAGECGWRTLIMMLGALDGQKIRGEVFSYEGPFGVGYMVARLTPEGEAAGSLYERLLKERTEKLKTRRDHESTLVTLARQALETYILEGRKILPEIDGPILAEKAGVFVSIKKHGQLRGCIGTISPVRPNIAQEIVANAISAGTGDPRFHQIEADELEDLAYSVDVLKEPEPVKGLDQLDVKRYGVIVRSGRKSGLLLPNLEGIDTVEEQVSIARQKAGIGADETVELERFEVIRYY